MGSRPAVGSRRSCCEGSPGMEYVATLVGWATAMCLQQKEIRMNGGSSEVI